MKKIIEGISILKHFYKILRNMWFQNNLQEENEASNLLYIQIMDLYGSFDIFKNSKQLIEFLIINTHNEIRTDNDQKKVNEKFIKLEENNYFNKEQIINEFYSKNNSIFQQLFFLKQD